MMHKQNWPQHLVSYIKQVSNRSIASKIQNPITA